MSVLDNIKDLLAAKTQAASVIANLGDQVSALLAAHAAKEKEIETIIGAPPPVSVLIKTSDRLIDAAAEALVQEEGPAVVLALMGETEERDGVVRVRRHPSLYEGHQFWTFGRLCALAPDAMKASRAALIKATVDPKTCLPVDRTALLQAKRAELREIEAAHTELVETFARFDPPIIMALLPAVEERRRQEAARVAREAEARRLQQSAEAAANAEISRPREPRAARNRYLTESGSFRRQLADETRPGG